MKIRYFGNQNSFALEMLRLLQLEHSQDEFFGLFAVSGGLTREIKFACHQIDDAGEVVERRYPRALAFAAVPDC